MIFLVMAALLLYRGAQINTDIFPYVPGAFASAAVLWLAPLGTGVANVLEVTFTMAQIGVIMALVAIGVYSKHLHIALAQVNVLFSRRPNALRTLEPMRSNGKVLNLEEAGPDTDVFGLAKIEGSPGRACWTWRPAPSGVGATLSARPGATRDSVSPKQVILGLRDHALAKAPYLVDLRVEGVALLGVGHQAAPPSHSSTISASTTSSSLVVPVLPPAAEVVVSMRPSACSPKVQAVKLSSFVLNCRAAGGRRRGRRWCCFAARVAAAPDRGAAGLPLRYRAPLDQPVQQRRAGGAGRPARCGRPCWAGSG